MGTLAEVSGLNGLAQRLMSHISTFADDKDSQNIKFTRREAASLPQF